MDLAKEQKLVNISTVQRCIILLCLLFGSLKKWNLASTGLKYWVSASSKLGDHENKWHKEAVDKCHDFIKTVKDSSRGIDLKMNPLEASQIKENISRVRLLMKSVDFLGKFNISLRAKNVLNSIKILIRVAILNFKFPFDWLRLLQVHLF